MREFIYPEMMVHIPLCTAKKPENVLIVSDDAAALESEVARHDTMKSKTVAASDLLTSLRDQEDGSADVILLDVLTDDAAAIAHVNRILRDDGLVVLKHPSLENEADNKKLMQVIGNYFKIIMPYYIGNGETLLLASKAYHPTADIILHRADMLDGLQYYNCDIHPAAFATPNYIRKMYLGVIKN